MRLRHAILWVLPLGIFFNAPLMAGSPGEVFRQVAASIVVVEVSGAKGEAISFGSGVIIAPGQVITNCHVIKDGKSFTIRQSNQMGSQPQPAVLRYQDVDRDLCQLEVTGFEGLAATIAISKLKTGQRVYAIGAPQGLELTISEGLISSLRELDGAQYIQTTAAISPGSSGGGLFDDNGSLIGITTFYFAEGQNLNFALPAAWIAELPQRAATPAAKPAIDNAIAWLNKAVALKENQDWPGLLAHSKKWGKARPGDADAWNILGFAYGKLNQTDKAIAAFREALRINPEYADAWNILGFAYGNLNQTDKAIEAFHEALRINPEHASAWNHLGRAYSNLKQSDKAIDAYREALRINPEHAEAWLGLGIAYGELKQYDKAIEAFHEALRINPEHALAWSILGAAYGKLNQPDKAIAAFREALRLNPEYANAWYSLGGAYGELKQYDKAIAAYREAQRINPEDADGWYNLGFAYGELKQYDKAIEAFKEALRINPEYAEAWYNLGVVYGKLNQTDKAIAAYREALRINPEHARAWNNLGATYHIQGNRNKVREIYQTLLKIDPEVADRYFNMLILP